MRQSRRDHLLHGGWFTAAGRRYGYRAPILVKGTALMIKAFASAPGRKDSPVVTGIFRIGE